MDVKKLVIGGLIVGGGWYAYQSFKNLSDQIVVGSPKFQGFSGGKLQLSIPVYNISRIDVSFDGFTGYIEVKNRRLGDVVIVNQRRTIPANGSQSFTVDVLPNWGAVAMLGFDVVNLIKTGKLKEVQGRMVGKGFSRAIRFDVNVPIV